ncbi:hypothetical protein [Natrarchaeobius chitinivorans]|uniref:DUF7978 domain-containing protein n=1 Tax=Natrarchaeobius chitinivorans TaxID=1679083 RepID=A0A3N6PBT7_NATCH|nr:hypothetical protein [Natrarchaeobius chitinivorans]RQG94095.1 hypothetical protein EA473_13605 [Natrarchaeobius chitinivorans]
MTRQRRVSTTRRVSHTTSVAASAGLGVLAAAIGYLLAYLLVAGEVREGLGESVAEWKGVGWYYYNAHAVDVHASGEIGSFGGTRTVDFIAQSGSTSASLLYVVPPVVLLGAGAILAHRLDVRDIGEAVLVGAPVAIGYVVMMGLGAVVTESSTEATFFGIEATGTMGPALVPSVVLAGILYPLVFATAGSILVAVLARRQEE